MERLKKIFCISTINFLVLFNYCSKATCIEKSNPIIDETPSIDDYIDYALSNNPTIKSSYDMWQASKEKITQEKSLEDPSVNYDIETMLSNTSSKRQAIGISQKFPWFGKLKLKKEIARTESDTQCLNLEGTKLDIIFQIKNLYYENYYIVQSIKNYKDNLNLIDYMEEVAQARLKSGSNISDLIKIQIEKSKLEVTIKSLSDYEKTLRSDFNLLLNREIDKQIYFPSNLKTVIIDIDETKLFGTIEDANPSIKAMDKAISGANFQIDLAHKNYFPDINFGIKYSQINESILNMGEDTSEALMASVMIDLPIWLPKYTAQKKEALYISISLKDSRLALLNNTKSELADAMYRYNDAKRKYSLYNENLVPRAQESFEVTESSYKTGSSGIIEFMDTLRTLYEFKLEVCRSFADMAIEAYRIEKLTGFKTLTSNKEDETHVN
jgi:outer membrane protein, heavy metal efflux system